MSHPWIYRLSSGCGIRISTDQVIFFKPDLILNVQLTKLKTADIFKYNKLQESLDQNFARKNYTFKQSV
ncbi:hypothetical protein EMIT0P291_260031 [Pseudomonas sp. IT-P291]